MATDNNRSVYRPVIPEVPAALLEERRRASSEGIGVPDGKVRPDPKAIILTVVVGVLIVAGGVIARTMRQAPVRKGSVATVAQTAGQSAETSPQATGEAAASGGSNPAPAAPRPTLARAAPPTSPPRSVPPTAAVPKPTAPPSPGTLVVNWKPWAEVSIAGHGTKTTPCTFSGLPPGTYTVKLSNPGFAAVTRSVTVASGRQGQLTGEFAANGTLNVNAVPWADVYIDGVKKGTTPLQIELSPGKHKVVLEKPGDPSAKATYDVVIRSDAQEKIVHKF